MKKKIFMVIMALVITLGVTATVRTEVKAADTKTATLSDLKVSFDGKEPIIIKSYLIDGSNYVRVADVVRHLDMNVVPARNKPGSHIEEVNKYSAGDFPALTEKTLLVTLEDSCIYYGGMKLDTWSFKYNDVWFHKISDIAPSAQHMANVYISTAKGRARMQSHRNSIIKTVLSLKGEWNAETKVYSLSKDVINLQAIFEAERIASGVKFVPGPFDQKESVAEKLGANAQVPKWVAPDEFTEAPKFGTTYGKILKDPSKGAISGNYNYPYTLSPAVGQCTWYAIGRFYEVNGVDISSVKSKNALDGSGKQNWVKLAMTDEKPDIDGVPFNGDWSILKPKSIAVWTGHVLFIEYLEYDTDGNIKTVFISEANVSSNDDPSYKKHEFNVGKDGAVKGVSIDFLTRRSGTFYGIIVAK